MSGPNFNNEDREEEAQTQMVVDQEPIRFNP
jgi:hypothetical protein